MLEALVCPNCAGPLNFSAADGESIQCPYCHTTVLRSGQSPRGGQASIRINRIQSPVISKPKAGPVLAVLFVVFVCVLLAIISQVDRRHPTGAASSSAPGKPPLARMILEFGSKGITPGHFKNASCIALDQQGHIYVGESGEHGRVQVFDKTGKYLSEFSVGGFDDFVADRDGTLYVMSEGKICRFKGLSGEKLPDMERASEDFGAGQTPVYYRCACLSPGVIHAITGYAIDVPRIVNLNTATGRVAGTDVVTQPPNETLNIHRILRLTTGEIYCLDTEKGVVLKFSPSGAYINKFGGTSEEAFSDHPLPSQLQSPSSMASDSEGRIYVGNGSGIKVYDKDGNYIDEIGQNEFANGVTIDDQDHIYACFANCVREYVLQKH
jgi:hypothetical protein